MNEKQARMMFQAQDEGAALRADAEYRAKAHYQTLAALLTDRDVPPDKVVVSALSGVLERAREYMEGQVTLNCTEEEVDMWQYLAGQMYGFAERIGERLQEAELP